MTKREKNRLDTLFDKVSIKEAAYLLLNKLKIKSLNTSTTTETAFAENFINLCDKFFPKPKTLAVFHYPNDNGTAQIRTLEIEQEDEKYIEGEDYYRQGGYRKFLKNKIVGKITYFNEEK